MTYNVILRVISIATIAIGMIALIIGAIHPIPTFMTACVIATIMINFIGLMMYGEFSQ